MLYFKPGSEKFLKQTYLLTGAFFVITIFTILFLAQSLLAYNPTTQDRFYIPQFNDPHYEFDGEINAPEWENVNWFTFGTEGLPEATVYARYSNDTLFLAFHFDYDVLKANDVLSICIDPDNTGGTVPGSSLLRYDIRPFSSMQVYSLWDEAASDWSQQSGPPGFINCAIDTNLSLNYWEAELEIICSDTMLGFGTEYFGLYFQIIDFVDGSDYMPFWWPNSASLAGIPYTDVPAATEWANARFVTPGNPTEPDIYFNKYHKHLMTSYPKNDLIIVPSSTNTITSIVHNIFIPGSNPNGNAAGAQLTFQYRDFGIGGFKNLNTTPHTFSVAANTSSPESIAWTAPFIPATEPDTVSLRAEFTRDSDPITCNNSTRRTMQYLKVFSGHRDEVEFTIENTDEEMAMNRAAGLYASAEPALIYAEPQQQYDVIYFYLDRSKLDSAVSDKAWDIRFALVGQGDSLTYLADRDSLFFGKNETKKFKLQFTAPAYCLLSAKDSASSLRIKVSKKAESYYVDKKVYNRIDVLGYCGADIQVIPAPIIDPEFILWLLGILLVVGGGFVIYKKMFQPTKERK